MLATKKNDLDNSSPPQNIRSKILTYASNEAKMQMPQEPGKPIKR